MAKENQENKSPFEQTQDVFEKFKKLVEGDANVAGEGGDEENQEPDSGTVTDSDPAPDLNSEAGTSTDPSSSPIPDTGSGNDSNQGTPPHNPFLNQPETSQQPEKSVGELLKDLDNVSVDTAFANEAFNVIGSIKFEDLIGNPLRAAMKAQRDMAKESLKFVKEDVMTTTPDGQGRLSYVTLSFRRDGKNVNMQVPLITLVPYPSLMITQMTYDFSAKIDALSSMVVGAGKDVKADWGPTTSWASSNKPAAGGVTPGAQKPQATDKPQAADKPQATDKPQTASTAGSADAAAAKMSGAKTNANASLGASYASGVNQGSRYNVQTTMDISITANSQEPPKGLTHIIDILDQCTEVINSNGELIVSAEQATLAGSVVAINATYRNPVGTYEPAKVQCRPYGTEDKKPNFQMLPNGDYVMLLFSEKGTYLVSAGIHTRVVIIN